MDFDKLISSVSTVIYLRTSELKYPATFLQIAASETTETNSARTAASRVSQMLSIRNIVKSMPVLARALVGSRSQLLQVIREVRYSSFSSALESIFNAIDR